jgi:hypothetical protein
MERRGERKEPQSFVARGERRGVPLVFEPSWSSLVFRSREERGKRDGKLNPNT